MRGCLVKHGVATMDNNPPLNSPLGHMCHLNSLPSELRVYACRHNDSGEFLSASLCNYS